jgi:hypothetical protein
LAPEVSAGQVQAAHASARGKTLDWIVSTVLESEP